LLAVSLGMAVAVLGCNGSGESATAPDRARVEVRIRDLVIDAELAISSEERTQGLAGRESLSPDEGMLFVHDEERQGSMWMRDMRFPLDVIWISADRRVVDVHQDLSPPPSGTQSGDLQVYHPSAPVLYFLEVNAGTVGEHGIQAGDAVKIEPEP
jgi:hypothetical protein